MNQNLVLYIKGIDWNKTNDDYIAGKFSRMVHNHKKIKVKSKKALSTIPDTDGNDTFTYKSNCNGSQIFFTTNCEAFNKFSKEQKSIYGGRCHNCKRDFKTLRGGIPLDLKFENGMYIVLYEGCNDTLSCSLSEFEDRNPANWRTQNYKYDKTLNILEFLCEIMYPGRKLCRVGDPKLLKEYGGSANEEQYENNVFLEIPDFIFVPIKTTFLSKAKKVEPEESE